MREIHSEAISKKKRRIGILGGSFNPVHSGHLGIAKKAYEQFGLDEVWFMSAGIQPFKQGISSASAADRAQMIRLAIRGIPYFSLCTYELEKKGVSYTCQTLHALCRMYPDCSFFFLLGADSLYSFEHWLHPEEICSCAFLLVACRHQAHRPDDALYRKAEELQRALGARIDFIDTPFYDISSTHIRELLSEGSGPLPGHLLPEAVYQYIREHGLYC